MPRRKKVWTTLLQQKQIIVRRYKSITDGRTDGQTYVRTDGTGTMASFLLVNALKREILNGFRCRFALFIVKSFHVFISDFFFFCSERNCLPCFQQFYFIYSILSHLLMFCPLFCVVFKEWPDTFREKKGQRQNKNLRV